jgi:hypothetical protein
MVKRLVIATVLSVVLMGGAALVIFADSSWLTGTPDEKFEALAGIQPGLGTVMIEYGNRMGNMYYAAEAHNWGMAAYQLNEAVEIQEVGETTRPNRASLLKIFEEKSLKPLARDIVNQDFRTFQNDFSSMVKNCNNCHLVTGHEFIVYELPSQPIVPAKMGTDQTFTRGELEKMLGDLLGNE